MNEFRADLHCHSLCSDGTMSPSEIIDLAIKMGLNGLSITDHDTIAAYPEAILEAQSKNIQMIPGVEFSAIHRQTSVHILAYSFSLNSPIIKSFCQLHQKRRERRTMEILKLLAAQGMSLSLDDFPSDLLVPSLKHSMGRPHIALAMLKKGYVTSIQQAFHHYLGEGKPCYIPSSAFTVEETIELIHRANGLAIIAHPHLIENHAVCRDLLEMNFDGIEGYYARFQMTDHERWLKIGARKGWIITGGSDFHGSIKPNLSLGSSYVNEETFALLKQHYQNHQDI